MFFAGEELDNHKRLWSEIYEWYYVTTLYRFQQYLQQLRLHWAIVWCQVTPGN